MGLEVFLNCIRTFFHFYYRFSWTSTHKPLVLLQDFDNGNCSDQYSNWNWILDCGGIFSPQYSLEEHQVSHYFKPIQCHEI